MKSHRIKDVKYDVSREAPCKRLIGELKIALYNITVIFEKYYSKKKQLQNVTNIFYQKTKNPM